jgi:hypothetical protein
VCVGIAGEGVFTGRQPEQPKQTIKVYLLYTMSGESTELNKHFTQLEKYVTEINVVQLSLDETQTVECPKSENVG